MMRWMGFPDGTRDVAGLFLGAKEPFCAGYVTSCVVRMRHFLSVLYGAQTLGGARYDTAVWYDRKFGTIEGVLLR